MPDTSNLAGDVDSNGDVVDAAREALRTAITTTREAVAARDRGELNDAAVALAWEVTDDVLDLYIDLLPRPTPAERFRHWNRRPNGRG